MDDVQDSGTDLDTTVDTSSSSPTGSGSVFTRKYGPLPVWAWGVVIGGTALVFLILRGRAPSASSGTSLGGSDLPASTDIPSSSQPDSTVSTDQLDKDIQDLITALQNQTSGSGNTQQDTWLAKLKADLTHLTTLQSELKTLQAGTLTSKHKYTALRGDTWQTIAKKFNITTQQLKSVNPNNPTVNRGEIIHIPVYTVDKTKVAAKQAEIKTLETAINNLLKKLGLPPQFTP